MNNMDPTLIERLKNMPKDELEAYLTTTHITGGISAIIGISSIFFTLMFTSWLTIIVTFIILQLFGNIAVAASDLKVYIRSLIKTKFGDK